MQLSALNNHESKKQCYSHDLDDVIEGGEGVCVNEPGKQTSEIQNSWQQAKYLRYVLKTLSCLTDTQGS